MLSSPGDTSRTGVRRAWRSGAGGALARGGSRRLLVHVAEEGLEHEQGPDRGAVVADAARVLVQQALDERHIEKIDLFQQAREKPPPDRLPQRAAEPVRQRDGE